MTLYTDLFLYPIKSHIYYEFRLDEVRFGSSRGIFEVMEIHQVHNPIFTCITENYIFIINPDCSSQ